MLLHIEELDWLLKGINCSTEDAKGIIRIFYSYTA